MNILERFKQKLLERAYSYVESGLHEWEDWSKALKEYLVASNNGLLELSDSEINEIVSSTWNMSYEIDGKIKTICEWGLAKRDTTKYQKEMRNSMDRLFKAVEDFRHSEFFLEMLKFSAKFKLLAPYNAMMVKTQMPSARYVLTARNWEKMYKRTPKRNARPLVVLRKYGPVDYVYEIADTQSISNNLFPKTDEDILNILANPYATSGKVDEGLYKNLIKALSYHGIKLDTFRVAASFGAQILKTPCNVQVRDIKVQGHYVISVNDKANMSTAFASICHELGHFFCYHLPSPGRGNDSWWTWRRLSWEEKEFEAEIVSFIICERYGVGNKSWKYLSQVIGRTGEIPANISVDRIFKAANEVERMLGDDYDPRSGYLYFNDKAFKKQYNKLYPKKDSQPESDESEE